VPPGNEYASGPQPEELAPVESGAQLIDETGSSEEGAVPESAAVSEAGDHEAPSEAGTATAGDALMDGVPDAVRMGEVFRRIAPKKDVVDTESIGDGNDQGASPNSVAAREDTSGDVAMRAESPPDAAMARRMVSVAHDTYGAGRAGAQKDGKLHGGDLKEYRQYPCIVQLQPELGVQDVPQFNGTITRFHYTRKPGGGWHVREQRGIPDPLAEPMSWFAKLLTMPLGRKEYDIKG
jgi:hypothetical protein